MSDFSGTAKDSRVKDKLVEIAYLNEDIAGTALAFSCQAMSCRRATSCRKSSWQTSASTEVQISEAPIA